MEPTVQFLLVALAILSIPCIGIVILVAFIIIGIPLARKHRQKWDEAWVQVARRTGLTYASKTLEQLGQEAQQQAAMEPPGKRRLIRVGPPTAPPRLVGQYRGFGVIVDSFTKDIGDETSDERRFTRVTLSVQNRENCRLTIRDRRFWSPRSALKVPEVQFEGDFGRRFVVQGDPAHAVTRLFGDGGLAQLLVAQASQYEVRLDNREVQLVAKGLETRPDALHSLLDLAVDLAARVDRK
jgi:hypothetical protein